MKSNFTKVNEINIHYLSAGEGDAILLFHGWPTSSYLWRDIIPILAENYQVIAIDLPGFGQSDKPLNESYSFRFYSRMIQGFLDNLGIEKVTLGMHDLGGPLALYWGVNNMEKVERMIFLNTLVYPEFSWGVKLFMILTKLPLVRSWLNSGSGISWVMNFGIHQKEALADKHIQAYQEPFKNKNARKVLLKTVHGLSPKGFREIANKLPFFKGPVQIVYGGKDRILPHVNRTMERVQKDLTQAEVVILPNCGHFLQEEASKEIGEILLAFMK